MVETVNDLLNYSGPRSATTVGGEPKTAEAAENGGHPAYTHKSRASHRSS